MTEYQLTLCDGSKAKPRNTEAKVTSKSRSNLARGREFGLRRTWNRCKRFEFAQDAKEVRLLLWTRDGICVVPAKKADAKGSQS